MRRTTFRYADAVVPITFKSSYGVDALYAPRRTILDPIVVEAAAAAGVHVRFDIAVADVERGRHGNVIGIVGRTRHGQPFRARGRIVVGEDGKGVRAGTAGQDLQGFDARVGEDSVEGGSELTGPVPDQAAEPAARSARSRRRFLACWVVHAPSSGLAVTPRTCR